MSPFNLFAFVLGGPKSNSALFATIESQFDRLSFVSGEKLLFFALAKAPNWRWRGRGGSAYERLAKFQPPSIGPDYEGALARALVVGLGIPESALPCIVVTNDLESKDLLWFSTTSDSIAEQLTNLGYVASRYDRAQIRNVLLAEQTNFDPKNPSGSASLDTSIAQAIADVLSFPVYRAGESDVQSATERARQSLDGIFNSLKEEKRKGAPLLGDEPDPVLLENLELNSLKGLSCLSLLSERPDVSLFPAAPLSMESDSAPLFSRLRPEIREREAQTLERPTADIRYRSYRIAPPTEDSQRWPNLRQLGEGLEAQSVHILKTALLVQDLFDSRPEVVAGLVEQQLDYTPTVICLAKVFEREANLSVVHWVRENLHISLPPYFNRYQPEIQAVFTPDRPNAHGIDFNKERNGIWIAPAMGQSELACWEFGRTSLPQGWSESQWSRLMRGWYAIRVGRNSAAHTELCDKESAMRLVEAIDRLAESRIFESMCVLKAKYRGF